MSTLNSRSEAILEATRNFCGGVAVSFGNKNLRIKAKSAIENLLKFGECKVMIHHLIYNKESVDEFVNSVKNYGDDIHYHVLLPLMKHGRSDKGLEDEVFEYLQDNILEKNINNVAFGANFYPYLPGTKLGEKIDSFPQESYSKNIILNRKVIITPSSFNLKPIKEIIV